MSIDTQDGAISGNEERILADLLCELLTLPNVQTDESILTLTGDSVTILKFVSSALAAGLTIDVVDVFECKTISALARRARENGER